MAKKSSNRKSSNKSKVSKGKSKSKVVKGKGKSKATATPKVNKGLNLYIRVRSVLWNEFKKDYSSKDYSTAGSQFLDTVGKVYRECRSRGTECTDGVLIEKYREIVGGDKRVEPFIGRELYERAEPFWTIEQIDWDLFEPYLWVVSPMILPAPHEFQVSDYLGVDGDSEKGYAKYFKEWVRYNNESEEVNIRVNGSDDIPYYIITKPQYKNDRWQVEIIIVQAGTETDRREREDKDKKEGTDENIKKWSGWKTKDYGFVPKGKIEEPKVKKTILPPSKKKKKEVTKVAEKETVAQRKVREATKKKIEAETRQIEAKISESKLEALYKKKASYFNDMKEWKALGDKEEMANTKKLIKITNLQIEKLTK